ncbi:hypothetical protein CYMTET_51741 [Cymbomonas tetramitiformis]|uniref:Uncharacterized protein n=1 Tax=Cymbomonas tetramitiformis TaxID=36881 RepID=A0AAE0BLP2_9CHLO|nr:hypothetical protein CYMTET_51741 [Cymbomonas tetramitiformis]|eukprot:gene15870-18819_t
MKGASGSSMVKTSAKEHALEGPKELPDVTQSSDSKRTTRDAESLGWITESGIMPKKQREIEGVSAASLVDLQAQLYRTQEDAKRRQEGLEPLDDAGRKKSDFKVSSLFERRNGGVEERDRKDMLHTLPEDPTSQCFQALERKAALYEKIARGEIPDNEDLYNVDFVRKGYLEDDPPEHSRIDLPRSYDEHGTGGMLSDDMQMARDRVSWEEESRRTMQEEKEREQRREQQKERIQEQAQKTRDGRERVQSLKERRASQVDRNRERLKAAFLKKQVEKLREAKN